MGKAGDDGAVIEQVLKLMPDFEWYPVAVS